MDINVYTCLTVKMLCELQYTNPLLAATPMAGVSILHGVKCKQLSTLMHHCHCVEADLGTQSFDVLCAGSKLLCFVQEMC